MNAFLSKRDGYTEQRKRAIRALAGKIDREEEAPIHWLLIALVCAVLFGIAVAVGIPEIVAVVLN